jgi:hypothetical protein
MKIDLPSGIVIEYDGPHELCISVIGSVLDHRRRLFYNLYDAQDRRALAEQVVEAWNIWAVTGEPGSGGHASDITLGGPGVRLPDGSGVFVASLPLPKTHWLYAEGHDEPPMPMRTGLGAKRNGLADQIRAAAHYAVRGATMKGKEMDFDPDALVQNMVVGMLGYWTEDGTR